MGEPAMACHAGDDNVVSPSSQFDRLTAIDDELSGNGKGANQGNGTLCLLILKEIKRIINVKSVDGIP